MNNLFVEHFINFDANRYSEYVSCLDTNCKLSFFDNIYVLITKDINISVNSKKIKTKHIITSKRGVTYQEIFNLLEAQNSNDINIIANADIYFDDTINLISPKINEEIAIGLSRHYPLGDPYLHPGCNMDGKAAPESNDVWIWKGKCKINNANFCMGYDACDGRIMQCFVEAGYRVYNPAKSIKTWHLHKQRNDSITERIEGPYWKGPETHHTIEDVL